MNKTRQILCVMLGLVLLASVFGGAYVWRVYHIKNNGVSLAASKDIPTRLETYYLQNDKAWADESIGQTQSKLRSKGCLIASVATAASTLGVPVTPGELNQTLTGVDGFEEADLIWYKLHEAYPQIDYHYSRVFTSKTIERDLQAGLFPIVCVKYHQTGISHWVLVVGAKDGEFLIADPLGDGTTMLPLSVHGKAYAYRVLIPSTEG